MTKVMVVDDEEMIRFAFEQFLLDEGCEPLLTADGRSALEMLAKHKPEVVFLDYRLLGQDGLTVLRRIKEEHPETAVVFMTAFGTMDVAIQAMQCGAYEYVTKPLDLVKIRTLIHRIEDAREALQALEEGRAQGTGASPGEGVEPMVGKGPAMQEIFKTIGLLTMQDITVLVTGESGVGKELVARAIHYNSARRSGPFLAVNCGAMPENLLEAEMFGYEKGAFTGAENRKKGKFEAAGRGTIFLDEIGDLQPQLQVKLLRVLQEKCFERIGSNTPVAAEARIIAATNKDLYQEVSTGSFRKDLFYRLHLVHLHIPPLRERKEDIPLLVSHFIGKANQELGRRVRGITDQGLHRLMEYPWPGNVRELENEIRRAMVISRGDVLSEYMFSLDGAPAISSNPPSPQEQLTQVVISCLDEALKELEGGSSSFDRIVALVERALLREALNRTNGNQVHAAQLLGINRSTLRKKRHDYQI